MSCAVPSLLERKSGDRRGAELWSAARDGDEDKIRSLLSAKPKLVNARDCGGNTALIWASLKGHEGCVQALLDLGADVEVTSDMHAEGETALMCARFAPLYYPFFRPHTSENYASSSLPHQSSI